MIAFAQAHGLKVTATHPNRVLLDVNGPVTAVEKAFHVTLRVYPHPTEQRTFFAPDVEPSLDLTVPVLHISGLDNFALPQPRLQATRLNTLPKSALPNAGSGPSGRLAVRTVGPNDRTTMFRLARVIHGWVALRVWR